MFKLFVEGGALGMSLLTLELIALLLAAWKAPGWVKEIGLIALVTGVLWTLWGVVNAAAAIEAVGEVPQGLLWGGIKVAMISLIYCLVIYLVSLVIRIVQKPRLL
jgi:hypothetical protein